MVLEDELYRQQQKIHFYNICIQKLNVKLYYEKNKKIDNEYLSNENDLSIMSTENKIRKMKYTLSFLLVEHQESMNSYVNLIKQKK
jgi:hypothetical protein